MTNYRVYLKQEYQYKECVRCENLDQVEIVLKNAEEYDEYLIVKHDVELDMDTVFDSGQIEKPINNRRKGLYS